MSSATSFTVSMVLNAVNNLSPSVRQAISSVQNLGATVQRVGNMKAGSSPFEKWPQQIKAAITSIEQMQDKMKKVSEKASEMRNGGFENVATGAAIGLPVMDMVKKASERQVSQLVLKEAGMSMGDVSAITDKSKELSSELMFSVNELMAIPLAMQRAGMNADKIKNSFQQVAYLTELEHLRTGRDSYSISKDLSSMAELAQVTGDQSKLASFFDTVNRIATVTHADVGTLAESTKYFMPVAKMYGMDSNDAMMAQGIMSRFGIQGSMAGTHLKDFVDRLNPHEFLKASGRSQQLTAMQEMGFLNNAQYSTLKTGGKKFTDVGDSAFFADGKVKGIMDIAGILGKKYADVMAGDPLHGAEKFAAAMKHIFGEQGKDVAILLAQNPEMIKQMQADLARVQAIDQSIKDFQTTFKQTFAAFLTNLENIGVEAVTQLMHDLTDGMKMIAPYVDSISKWAESHKSLVNSIVRATIALSAFLLVLGTLGIIGGTALKLIAGGLIMFLNPFKWALQFILWLVSGFGNLAAGFALLRQTGAGFFSSLARGAALAWPWLGRLAGWVWFFVGQWLVAAGRIAAGWLIAMGPVGWIIAGVTAIILAAIWAWNTNFWGFRDKCKEIWASLSNWASKAIEAISTYIDKMMLALGLQNNMAGFSEGKLKGIDLSGDSFAGKNAPFLGGGNGSTNNISQNVIVNVPTTNDANQFVANLEVPGNTPGKYEASRNPSYF